MAEVNMNAKIYKTDDGNYFLDIKDTGDGKEKYDAGEDILLTDNEAKILKQLESDGSDIIGHELGEILDSISDKVDGKNVDSLEALKNIYKALEQIKKEIAELANKKSAATDPTEQGKIQKQIELLNDRMDALKKEAKETLGNAELSQPGEKWQKKYNAIADKLGLDQPFDEKSSDSGDKKAASSTNSGTQGKGATGQKGMSGAQQPGGLSYGWSSGGDKFNMDAYLKSCYMDQSIVDGFDSVNKNKAQQQKMMMLFFYFATMAMSGDLGAMYRFMQFITYIISKQKARLNVQMGAKIIELENSTRAALQALFDQPTPDGSDQTASYEFTKVLENTKATQSSVATSQKLIAQMMEEMAQVVETLTGATKAALDANGRILQRLTRG